MALARVSEVPPGSDSFAQPSLNLKFFFLAIVVNSQVCHVGLEPSN